MAIQHNGQPIGPIFFTDETSGKRVFIGANQPTNPVDGDVWIDSDVLNNAGKNLISEVPLSGLSTKDLSILSLYKDVYVIFRGVTTSANTTISLTLNGDVTNYVNPATALFTIQNYKSATSTNHFTVDIVDTQDTGTFAWGYLKGVYTNSSNAVTILDATNAWTQTGALTKLTIAVASGTFTGGSALVYGVN